MGVDIGAGTSGQYPNSVAVSASELLPGDLGFLAESDGSGWNHVPVSYTHLTQAVIETSKIRGPCEPVDITKIAKEYFTYEQAG